MYQKFFFNVLFVIISIFVYCQNQKSEKFFQFDYTNFHSVSSYLLTQDGYIEIQKSTNGFGTELNTFHGFFITKKIALTLGIGLDWQINRSHLTNLVIFNLRWFLNSFGYNSPYVFIEKGENIPWNSKIISGGRGKLGLGYTLESQNEDLLYFFEIYKKTKYSDFKSEDYTYTSDSFGISFGIMF